MFHSRFSNNKVKRLSKHCKRIIHNDKNSNFEEILEKDHFASLHYRHVQPHATGIYKVISGKFTEIVNKIFQPKGESHYNFNNISRFIIPLIYSVYHGSESVLYYELKI